MMQTAPGKLQPDTRLVEGPGRRAMTAANLMNFVSWSFEVIDKTNCLMPGLGIGDRDYLVVLTANQNWMSRLWIGRAPVDRAALGLCAVEAYRCRIREQANGCDGSLEQPVLMPRFVPGVDSGSIGLWRTDTNRTLPSGEARLTFARAYIERHAPQSGLLLAARA